MSVTCPSCGTPAATDDARHCHVCGAPLGSAGPAPSPEPAVHPSGLSSEVRNWAMLTHLSALAAIFGVPVVGPLVVWLVKRDEHPFVDMHGKEALNFNISVLIYGVVGALLIVLVVGIVLLVALAIFWFVLTIIACVRASNGEPYRYPLTIRFVN